MRGFLKFFVPFCLLGAAYLLYPMTESRLLGFIGWVGWLALAAYLLISGIRHLAKHTEGKSGKGRIAGALAALLTPFFASFAIQSTTDTISGQVAISPSLNGGYVPNSGGGKGIGQIFDKLETNISAAPGLPVPDIFGTRTERLNRDESGSRAEMKPLPKLAVSTPTANQHAVRNVAGEEAVFADPSDGSAIEFDALADVAQDKRQAELTAPQTLPQPAPGTIEREKYREVTLNSVKRVAEAPVSTFSIDVDTASYANLRRMINNLTMPPTAAVRIEEMVNYFNYDYELPADRDRPFKPNVAVWPSPWNEHAQLLHIGIKGFDIPEAARPAADLVFLIDVSGSMQDPAKLPLLQKSFRLLVDRLGARDNVSIVVYAGAAGTVLEPTAGDRKATILAAIDRLRAGGSTAGAEGIRQAYALATENFHEGAINRVILATDGDFNVGITNDQRLEDFVAKEKDKGIFLTVLGFGTGNYQDARMQVLAQAGNGNAFYIDTLNEARKVMVEELTGTLFTIARDVKIQVEFNPARVAEYRLIGYETRMLNREDFRNDKVDAGDIGAGHSVTAIYEITPPGSPGNLITPSRYTPDYAQQPETVGYLDGELAMLRLRYKLPGEDASRLIERPITGDDIFARTETVPQDMRWAAAVAGFGQILRGDPFLANGFDHDAMLNLARGARGDDPHGYRAEFIQLAELAKNLPGLPPLTPPYRVSSQ